MNLKTACSGILSQLSDLTEQLTDQEFIQPIPALGNATLGQHLRHTLEFFICLERGLSAGVINYDKRDHNLVIESNRLSALAAMQRVNDFIQHHEQDASLKLEVGYDLDREDFITIDTNYFRELAYNIEHAVHHMAIIKIGVKQLAPHISLPHVFGIAASTLRYQDGVAPR